MRLVERFILSDKVYVSPALYHHDNLRRNLIITLSMTKGVQHIWEAIRFENTRESEPVFDQDRPLRSTGDMVKWFRVGKGR